MSGTRSRIVVAAVVTFLNTVFAIANAWLHEVTRLVGNASCAVLGIAALVWLAWRRLDGRR